MTARIVITSTLHHARHKPRHHRESDIIPGTATCGTILRRPHRAIAVDDGGLCAACWPDIHSLGTSSRVSDHLGTIGTTPEGAPTPLRGLTKSAPVPAKSRGV